MYKRQIQHRLLEPAGSDPDFTRGTLEGDIAPSDITFYLSLIHILQALATTPLPEATDYVAEEPVLQGLPAMVEVYEHLFGGMPVQLGWCKGHNTKLNCLEYHLSLIHI